MHFVKLYPLTIVIALPPHLAIKLHNKNWHDPKGEKLGNGGLIHGGTIYVIIHNTKQHYVITRHSMHHVNTWRHLPILTTPYNILRNHKTKENHSFTNRHDITHFTATLQSLFASLYGLNFWPRLVHYTICFTHHNSSYKRSLEFYPCFWGRVFAYIIAMRETQCVG